MANILRSRQVFCIPEILFNVEAAMDLTPITIPGKNKRDNRKPAIAERKALVSWPNRLRKLHNSC